MPATYAGLKYRHHLGDDPFDPHNNVLAGVAYIREMYDRFGAPGFLAAYNAGPDRLSAYLAGTSELPDETINYLASITPHFGHGHCPDRALGHLRRRRHRRPGSRRPVSPASHRAAMKTRPTTPITPVPRWSRQRPRRCAKWPPTPHPR